jgi:tRNA-2-methylthio-N6-dimethylallyladenosine synthase
MDAARFDNAYIFKYSPREGTPAAALVDDVSPEEKLRRNHVLLADQDRRGLELHDDLVGTVVEILAEGPSLRNKDRWAGRTTTNKIAIFEPRATPNAGDIVRILVDRVGPQTLYGSVVGDDRT